MEILADITGKKIVVVQQSDASAIGAGYLAAEALNLIPDHLLVPSVKETIAPNRQHQEVYSKNFELFKHLYQDLAPTMHKLKNTL